MRKKICIAISLFATIQLGYAQQELPEKENPFSFEASYVGDAYGNAAGGLKTGGGYMGMGNMKIGFDTEKARWWKGGSFFINGASIHGKSLSEEFLGDLQIASNIDAGTHTYLHELWFKQSFKKFSFTVGLQDLNAEFLTSDNAGEFINSSFGVPPTVSCNVPAPIFPLPGLGITAQWNITNTFAWQTTVFDGCQTDFDDNPYNINWKPSKDDGVLVVSELLSTVNFREKEGRYKLGVYYHSGLHEFDEQTQARNSIFKHNYGFYIIADQTVFEQEKQKIGLFMQIAAATEKQNEHSYYLGLGGNYYGIFSKAGKDVLGLAVASVDLKHRKNETALEMYYKWQFNDNFAIQPDIQYIINPSGTDEKLSNALAGILRLHINF
ncbi:MAG: carbohydrate porin [Bacteroidales bacterium]|jgi:porin|nr:carbohydrate porin [Bacteroidales bacterium]